MKTLRILIYCPVFYPNNTGYANAFLNLINAALDNDTNLHLTVITPAQLDNHTELSHPNLSIVRMPWRRLPIKKLQWTYNEIMNARYISNYVQQNEFELVFIETIEAFMMLPFLSSKILKKALIRIHATNETEITFFSNEFEYRVRRFMLCNFFMKRIRNISATNTFHLNFAKKWFYKNNVLDTANYNFFVIPNTTPTVALTDYSCGNRIRTIILGRMDPLGVLQKGFVDLFYALRLLPNSVINRFDITVIGDGIARRSLHAIGKSYENIEFLGKISHEETIQRLSESDLVILPSRFEGLSMFAIESLATGNACLFSRTGGLLDLIDGNGLYCEPQNIDSLATSIEQFSKMTPDEIQAMKQRSVEIHATKFAPEIVTDRFKRVAKLASEHIEITSYSGETHSTQDTEN